MSKVIGGTIGFLFGGLVVFFLFAAIVSVLAGPFSSADMTTGGLIIVFFGPVAALLGAIIGAVVGVRIASPGEPNNK